MHFNLKHSLLCCAHWQILDIPSTLFCLVCVRISVSSDTKTLQGCRDVTLVWGLLHNFSVTLTTTGGGVTHPAGQQASNTTPTPTHTKERAEETISFHL